MRPLFVLCLLAVASLATSAFAAELVPVRSISVSGMAERKVTPDEAHLYITLGSTNVKMAEAKKLHDAKLKKLFAIAEKNGIPQKHLSTQSSSVQPYYTYENNKQNFRGYRVQTTIDMKLDDIRKVGSVTEQILASGLEEANQQEYGQLLSTNYTIANPDKVRDDLLGEAIRNARIKAENMAEAAGAKIGRVYQINEGDMPSFAPRPMMAMAMAKDSAEGASAVAPPPGEQDMRSTVTVIYELQ